MRKEVIKLDDVWKIYQLGEVKLTVLKGVSLQVNAGDFMTIMGPSGSGKSTLMYILGSLDIPTKGKVFLDGEDTSKFSEDRLAVVRGRKIGFVFQQFNLLPNLTALENVALPMLFQGVPESEREKKSKDLLERVGLGERFEHKPAELSGGEQQRIAVARSLANDPEIIVADEPTGNLDSVTGKKIMTLLKNLHQEESKTIVVVTHDPKIADYSENIVNIKDGEMVSNHKTSSKFAWKR